MLGFGMEYEGPAFWLPLVWAGLLAIAVAMYVVIDGFDLGVGILFTAAQKGNWRDRMMLSVAPIWDGNETWLILGGGGLFAVFSVAYAILLPALYLPIILMLIALIFRGVAFEFRFKADTSQFVWDYAFHYGSLVATFAQGVVLGAFVQGFKIEGRGFAGGTFDWLTPFSVMTGIGLDLRLRAARRDLVRDEDHGRARDSGRAARPCSSWSGTIVSHGDRQRLGAVPRPAHRAALVRPGRTSPISGAGAARHRLRLPGASTRASRRARHVDAVPADASACSCSASSGWRSASSPIIVPPAITIWQAANAVSALHFALVGYAVVMPLTFAYTAYAYWVFRGKVAEDLDAGGYGH